MAKLITMKQKENEQYVDMYPKTDWSQVNGADAQIATVNNRISTVQSNLQSQINQKQDASTAVNQGNFGDYVQNYTGTWVLLGEAIIDKTNETGTSTPLLAAGTLLKNIVAFKTVVTFNGGSGSRSGGTASASMGITGLNGYGGITCDVTGGDSVGGDIQFTYPAAPAPVTTYYRIVADNYYCSGAWKPTGDGHNYTTSFKYSRNLWYFPDDYGSSSYSIKSRIQVNPTTCQTLTDIYALYTNHTAIAYNFSIRGNAKLYGLKLNNGEF